MTQRIPHLPPHLEGQSSWLSKATSARFLGHPLVWSGMTGLFILAGYLWLQYYARPLSDQLGQEHADSELVGAKSRSNWNPEIYRPSETRENMPITHQADTSRATQFQNIIDLENQIQPLLNQARSNMEIGSLTANNGDNAWQNYQRILEISPEYKLALSGQAQILGKSGIRCNVVSPGPIFVEGGDWNMIKDHMADFYEATQKTHPGGELGTTQDVANVAESSSAIVYTELTEEGGLYISITIPSLIVATFGGGTALPTQTECLEILGCKGKGKVNKLAEIIGGVVLAGEISLASAICSLDWVSSHEKYGRNR